VNIVEIEPDIIARRRIIFSRSYGANERASTRRDLRRAVEETRAAA